MTRYEEIMDHIEVTEEMRDRILENIDQEMRHAHGARGMSRGRTRRIRTIRTWAPILAAAAVLLVVCGVTFGVGRGGQGTSGNMPETELAMGTSPSDGTEDAAATESANIADASEAAKESAGDTDSMEDFAAEEDVVAAIYAPEMYDSAQELADAVGFEIQDLTSVPFAIASIEYYAIDDLAEIDYRSMGNVTSLTYRKSPGTDDNSGDYSDYEFVEDAAIGEHPLTLKGNDERYYLATWTDGTYAYSIYVSDGCSHDEMLAMIEEAEK